MEVNGGQTHGASDEHDIKNFEPWMISQTCRWQRNSRNGTVSYGKEQIKPSINGGSRFVILSDF